MPSENQIILPFRSSSKVLLLDMDCRSSRPFESESSPIWSRRDALRIGMLAAGTLLLPPYGPGLKANPVLPWLYLAGRAAFAGAVSWLVGRVLDLTLPDEPERLGVKKVEATPTRDAFHNSHADPYVVAKPQYNFSPRYSQKYRYYMELSDYLRSDSEASIPRHKDLALHEIKRIANEEPEYGTILFPCGKRCVPSRNDRNEFVNTASLYDVNPSKLQLDYVRPFNNGSESFKGFGVRGRRTGGKDLLISV